MSTRCSIKWREQTDASPGFHLYDDCLDVADEGQETPVYLRLDGVSADMTTQRDGATVTVAMPREMARELGLLPASAPSPSVGADGLPELPKVGPIGYASVVDVQSYAPWLKIGPHLVGVRDVALWTTDQMRAYALAALASRPVGDGGAADKVRALLWGEHPECCGRPVVGAEYMGQSEMVCCGNPEPAMLNDAQIVASLRAMFPDAARGVDV